MTNQAEKPNRPVHEIRMGGVVAAIWANVTESGRTFHTVTPYRIYKDDRGEWHRTMSFDRDDLPLLMKVADQAHDFIFNQAASGQTPVPAPVPSSTPLLTPPPAREADTSRPRNGRRGNPAPA